MHPEAYLWTNKWVNHIFTALVSPVVRNLLNTGKSYAYDHHEYLAVPSVVTQLSKPFWRVVQPLMCIDVLYVNWQTPTRRKELWCWLPSCSKQHGSVEKFMSGQRRAVSGMSCSRWRRTDGQRWCQRSKLLHHQTVITTFHSVRSSSFAKTLFDTSLDVFMKI